MSLLTRAIAIIIMSAVAYVSIAQEKRFGVQNDGGTWWLTRPEGKQFWSFGVCCVHPGTPWNEFDPANPSYCGWKLFSSGKAWVEDTLKSLDSWGFNSLGGWADLSLIRKNWKGREIPYTIVLHLGAYDKAPWHDLFDKQMEDAIEKAAQDQIVPLLDDPNLIGYFTDNELGWWDGTLFHSYTALLPANSPGRKRVHEVIREHYSNSWQAFQKDWISPDATNFQALSASPKMYLRPGGNGTQVIDAVTKVLATRYYEMVHRAIRRHDKTRLILGDRYIQYYTLPVVEASKGYVDVVSTNMGADWLDGGFADFFLRTLNSVTGKAVMITEFYMTATENRTGNKNTGNIFPVVATQKERAVAFAKNVRELAVLPFVVGAHWFQFHDEPKFGRADGEDYNMGLVDIEGLAYDQLVAESKRLQPSEVHRKGSKPTVFDGSIPNAPRDALAGLKDWPRSQGLIPCSTDNPTADLYVCSDQENLYLGLFAMDYVDEKLYEGGKLPASERSQWKVQFAGQIEPITVRFLGKDQKASVSDAQIRLYEKPGLKYTILLAIPRKLLKGTALSLSSELITHSRARHLKWNQNVKLVN